MAGVFNPDGFTALSLLLFLLVAPSVAFPVRSFSFQNFTDLPTLRSKVSLSGDARFVDADSSVQLTLPARWSSGRIMSNEPIRLLEEAEASHERKVSFFTRFSFSISTVAGEGLSFVLIPAELSANVFDWGLFSSSVGLSGTEPKFFAVEFRRNLTDEREADAENNVIVLDVPSLIPELVGSEKLQAWIDFEAGSNRLEIWLNISGNPRPMHPLISYDVDLSGFWKEKQVFPTLSSSNKNSSETCKVYSWSFERRLVPRWLHSRPLDPSAELHRRNGSYEGKKNSCVIRFTAALIVGAGFGAFVSFLALFLCNFLSSRRRPVVPENTPETDLPQFQYKKIIKVNVKETNESAM